MPRKPMITRALVDRAIGPGGTPSRAIPNKWRPEPCAHCGTGRLVNPAWLRERREAAGLTLRDVGALVGGMSAQYLCDIERGRRACPVRVREAYERLEL